MREGRLEWMMTGFRGVVVGIRVTMMGAIIEGTCYDGGGDN